MRKIIILLCTLIVTPLCYSQLEEIVVTGSRVQIYDSDVVPVVHIRRRADFLVSNISIESDSRDEKLRYSEVMSTVKALEKQARRNQSIELGILKTFETDDTELEYVDPFTVAAVERAGLMRGNRIDTSQVRLLIKTPIKTSDDNIETVAERIEDFIDDVSVTGRAVIKFNDDPGLSIVNISQYRMPLIKKIAEDNAQLNQLLGSDYKLSISGLDEPVRWRVVSPLEVALYFPYYVGAVQGN